jgi:hypothetical protein
MFRGIKILRHAPEKGKVGSEAGQGSRFVDGLLAIGALLTILFRDYPLCSTRFLIYDLGCLSLDYFSYKPGYLGRILFSCTVVIFCILKYIPRHNHGKK